MTGEIAIIGYGRFGRLAARYIVKYRPVCVADTRRTIRVEPTTERVSIKEAASRRIILLAVPINKIRSAIGAIAPYLKPGTVVCDVCSVKERPVQWMKKLLPKHTIILGTHPLFGPDSVSGGLKGKSIVLCPVRISPVKLRRIARFLKSHGLETHTMSAAKHDRLMAETLFLTQFIGHGLLTLRLPGPEISTQNYRLLMHVAQTTGKDSDELFRDMYQYNRYARQIPNRIMREFQKLREALEGKR